LVELLGRRQGRGGVAGHAGLFGTLVAVERAAVGLLRDIQRPGTLRDFATSPGVRGLGFVRCGETRAP
jgi:hypothetical protein